MSFENVKKFSMLVGLGVGQCMGDRIYSLHSIKNHCLWIIPIKH